MIIENAHAQHASEDAILVKQAQQGDLEAFTALYERYFPMVYQRVRYVIPEGDVEDVTQDIFIAVMWSLKSFKGESSFRTWLRVLTKRRVADFYRRRASRPQADVNLDDMEHLASEVDESAIALEDRIAVRKAMRTLPEDYQDVILYRFAEGMQFHEIADQRGQSLEAVKSLFRRAITALRTELDRTNA